MNKEQKELFIQFWHPEIINDSRFESNLLSQTNALKIWQACLDVNKDKMIDIDWPENKNIIGCALHFVYKNESEIKNIYEKDLIKYIPRPVEKWQPKEGEWRWNIEYGHKTLTNINYSEDFRAKFNPENFDAESKMTEVDFRNRGDFMEAGE